MDQRRTLISKKRYTGETIVAKLREAEVCGRKTKKT